MACLGLQIVSFGDRRLSFGGGVSEEMNCRFRRSMLASGDHRRLRWRSPKMCCNKLGELSSDAAVDSALRLVRMEVNSGSRQNKPMASPQLDQLMKDCVAEIVKNINEAPFLVQVYSEDAAFNENRTSSKSRPLKLVIDKATSESWPFITQSWDGGNSTPDGVILVEEFCSADAAAIAAEQGELTSSDTAACCTGNGTQSSSKVWGLLVQGRGVGYPACYILKTCQVQCCFGFSTHFCLAKVDCFGQDIDFHLRKLWLQS